MKQPKQPIYDDKFFKRIQSEIDSAGKEMVMCVVRYMNQELTRDEYFKKLNALCDQVEITRKEERVMLDRFGEIIRQIEQYQNQKKG